MRQSRNTTSAPGGKTARVLAALLFLPAIVFLSAAAASAAPITRYVNASATGANDGTSWASAFNDLQSALDAAESGDAIWVAAGTYTPSRSFDGTSDPRTAAFILKSGVAIYGGFAGSETAIGERSSDPGLTVLSGDIGTAGDHADNSYHVVYAVGVTNAVFDGFTVTGGRSNGGGGGMYNKDSTLTVSNCVFSDNKARHAGGGMYNEDSALTVSDCVFSGNQAGEFDHYDGQGGGMYNLGVYTDLESPVPYRSSVITGCTFRNNRSDRSSSPGELYGGGGGGGMFNRESQPTVDRCTFERNRAWGSGSLGGGMYNWLADPTITNCVFNGNVALRGGGGVANHSVATILNSTFYGNGSWLYPSGMQAVTENGGAIFQDRGGSRIVDVIFSGNAVRGSGAGVYSFLAQRPGSVSITKCLFHENRGDYGQEISHVSHLGYAPEVSESMFDVDPLLADPEYGNFHLREVSPAIDAGVTQKYAKLTWLPLPGTDFEEDGRVIDGDGLAGGAADIGADEYVPTLQELRDLIEGLADTGQIDASLAAVLVSDVDDIQAALDGGDVETARSLLEEMTDWLKSLEDTDAREAILRKAEAVHGTFD